MSRLYNVMSKIAQAAALTSLSLVLLSCSNTNVITDTSKSNLSVDNSEGLFREVYDVIPFEDRKRRKFDNAVIADLDQDGRQDIIINEHGLEIKVFWNDGDVFSKGLVLAKGDVHGAAVSDFDKNGQVDIVITQGGGDGANPRNPLWIEINKQREITKNEAFNYFEAGRGRAAKFIRSPVDGNLNLLVTGFATPKQMKIGANYFYDNQGDSRFAFQENLPNAGRLGFRATVTDLNSDGIQDVLLYGAGKVVAIEGLASGGFKDSTETVFGPLAKLQHVHAITEIDFDNDGDHDLFFTRAEFQFDLENYYDAETKRFAFLSFRKDFLLQDIKVKGDLVIDNLQRTYPHRDLFLGASKTKFDFQGDPHGHQDIVITPDSAMGWPEGEIKGGLYIGYLGDGMWRIGGQTQSRIAASIANVMEAPLIEPQPDLPSILLENKNGRFVDSTDRLNLKINEQTTSAAAADFNNDGWLDIAVLRYGSMASVNAHLLYINDAGQGFKLIEKSGLFADEVGTTGGFIEAFDYNSDGLVDILFSNERGRWHLMKNAIGEASRNNFVIFDIARASQSEVPLHDSFLALVACGKTYVRKVATGSSAYSQSLNTRLHFGLGKCTDIESVTLNVQGETKRVLDQKEIDSLVVREKIE